MTTHEQVVSVTVSTLLQPMTVAVVPDEGSFLAIAKEADYTARGVTRDDAWRRWVAGWLSMAILKGLNLAMAPTAPPAAVWEGFAGRSDATVHRFDVLQSGPHASGAASRG